MNDPMGPLTQQDVESMRHNEVILLTMTHKRAASQRT
jgi:hypothetical protein